MITLRRLEDWLDWLENHNHFGNSEVRWLDNLPYLYTRPFDVVVPRDVGFPGVAPMYAVVHRPVTEPFGSVNPKNEH